MIPSISTRSARPSKREFAIPSTRQSICAPTRTFLSALLRPSWMPSSSPALATSASLPSRRMPTAVAADIKMYGTDIYSEPPQLRRPLAWSFGLHLGFALFIVLYATFITGMRGEGWGSGGGGDAMGAKLVNAIPLPANPTESTNVLATESKGLAKSVPKLEEPQPEAIPIPDKTAKTKIKPAPVKSATQRKPEPVQEETNQIPY